MEQRNFTKDLIETFYQVDTSKKLQLLFQKWFLTNRNVAEQNRILYHLWNQTDNISDESTKKDLKEVNISIDMMKKTRKVSGWFLRFAAIIILPLLMTGLTFYLTKEKYAKENVMVQHYVRRGDVQCITLSDSTVVWINSESTLIYPSKFERDKRVVYLIGEANFQVTKSEKLPFIVQTSKMDIRVLGTKFNVEAYPDGTEIIATLEEGEILVNINDERKTSFHMIPNEEVALNMKTGDILKRVVNVENSNAWRKGDLAFCGASLEYIFQQIERKYDVRINYNLDSSHTDQRLTIRFSADDSIEDIFHVLQNIVTGLKIKIANDENCDKLNK
jgi:ferric-dicitrate binding protein FerR (iron transport regulator)